MKDKNKIIETIGSLQAEVHQNAKDKGFWDEERNDGEMIVLSISELIEGLEALRIGNMSGKHGFGEEMADTVIRIMDHCAGRGINLGKEIVKKMEINKKRPYKHGREDRMKNDNNRVIEIEDYRGNTLMAFVIVDGEVVKTENCNLGDVTADYIFGTEFPLIRMQSEVKEDEPEIEAGNGQKYRLLRLEQKNATELDEQGHPVELAITSIKIALENAGTDLSNELHKELYDRFGQKTANERFLVEVVSEWIK